MAFLLRCVQEKDIRDLRVLSSQFTLINLPNDPKALEEKVHRSIDSFSKKLPQNEREYLFVVEDTEAERVVGSSMILAKHGTPEAPHYYFKIIKREHFSQDLGIGFVHQVLKLEEECDGPTEIGGLLVDGDYRRISEKIGKQISLVRFLYMAMNRDCFQKKLLCELSPPNMAQGKSDFWEALGRRFTGLPYQEADRLSHKYKEFISTLFPTGEIYTCILSSAARFVLGRVGEETRPAQHLLEKLGFQYLNEVDPFDGGPHFGVETEKVPLIQNARQARVQFRDVSTFKNVGLVGVQTEDNFCSTQSGFQMEGEMLILPTAAQHQLQIQSGELVWVTPVI